MTHKERVLKVLNREPVDILPCQDSLWPETRDKYIEEGHLKEDEDFAFHFNTSMRVGGWFTGVANLDFENQILEEDEESRLVLDGNGARLRNWKHHSGTPEHVDFTVKERDAWDKLIKPHLVEVDRRRIPFDRYREQKRLAEEQSRAFCWHGVAPFEQMHPVCGHEYMLMGMALDPDWVKDMVQTFADFTIMHQKVLFEEEGVPDFIWYYEDMGFKEKPFMSPAMYEDIVQPGHAKIFEYAHSRGCKVLVHSCGFIEPLVPGLVDAGMDCLQAMEVKAGMDMPRIAEKFGDKIAFCGNIDIREIASNDYARIDAELDKKILPVLRGGGSYILHSDHSIPPDVEHDTLKYFFERGCAITERV
jgi:uroporphyrinogen decarboxylase